MVQRHIGMTMKGVRTALSCAVGVGRGKGALVDLGELHGVVLSTVQHPAIHYDYYLQSLKTKMVVENGSGGDDGMEASQSAFVLETGVRN